MLAKIKPIKIDFVWIGNLYRQKFNKLLNKKTPIKPPITRGNRNFAFSLGALKKFKMLFNNLS